MDEIDNILNDIGVNTSSETPAPSVNEAAIQVEPSHLSDEDISEIISENIQDESPMDEGEVGQTTEELVEELNQELDEYLGEQATPSTPVQETLDENDAEDIDNGEEESQLPLNSPTLLVDESTTRFSGAEWYNEIQKARIVIAGVGGIGSNVAFQIARMSPASLILYDDDTVEMTNMSGQLYSREDVGSKKVDAIARMISNYTTAHQVMAIPERFDYTKIAGDVMICGFDNMAARKTFFYAWKYHLEGKTKEEKAKCLFLDGRLSLDTMQIICITGDDPYNIGRYEEHFLFSDSEAEPTVCSMKQTTYMACLISSLMVNLFTNFIANQLNPVIPYDLPFFTEYTAPNILFRTEN